MSVSNTIDANNCNITLFTDGISNYVETSGAFSNICDNNEDTSFYYYFYTNTSTTKVSTYTIVPKSNYVATFHVHIHLWRDSDFNNDKERLVITVYKTDGSSISLYDSGQVNDINLNSTFDIYANITKIEMRATHKGCSPKCHNYEIGIKTLTPSSLYGRQASGIVHFLDDDENGSKFKYKDLSGKIHSVFLVSENHICASEFKVKTTDGIFCLGKMP